MKITNKVKGLAVLVAAIFVASALNITLDINVAGWVLAAVGGYYGRVIYDTEDEE